MTDIFNPNISELEYTCRTYGSTLRNEPMAEFEPCTALENFEANNPGLQLKATVITDPDEMPGSGGYSELTCAMRRMVGPDGMSFTKDTSRICTVCARRIKISQVK